MTTLPTTAIFLIYESVNSPQNHFIKEEALSTKDYLSYFYPFEKPDFKKKGMKSGWSMTGLVGITKKPLSQAEREMNFAARSARISLMPTNQEKRKRGTKAMIENRNI